MSVIIQGQAIAAEASEISLPAKTEAKLVESAGAFPEVEIQGVRFLASPGTKSKPSRLFPRITNTATGHAAIALPEN